MDTKECKRCRIDKELDEFFDPDNLFCKECNIERVELLNRKNKERYNGEAYADVVMFDIRPEDY